jgi:hypothetical protein
MGPEVAGGAAGWGGDDESVTHELGHPFHPVDRRRLAEEAKPKRSMT